MAALHLDLLRSFIAVYRTGSFSRSAVYLGLSQPGVTAQIRNLEQRLGYPLFDRTPQGAIPLAQADVLAKEIAAHMDALETLWSRHTDEQGETEPTVYIAGPAELLGTSVIPALHECLAMGIRVHAVHGTPETLLKGLGTGRYDLVISTTKPGRSDLSASPLFDEQFILIAPPGYGPLEGVTDCALEAGDFPPECRLIAYAPDLPVVRRYWRMVYNRIPDLTGSIVVPDLRSVLNAVTAGLGISVVPTYLCAPALERGEVEIVYHPPATPFNTIYLVRRRSAKSDVATSKVHDVLKHAATSW